MDLLYIEDNVQDADLVFRILDSLNITDKYQLLTNGEQAAQYLDTLDTSNKPRLILLDIKLPKLDGFEVLKLIRENRFSKDIPVVIFSTSILFKDQEKAYALGANSYLIKPDHYPGLKEIVKQLGVYWLDKNSVPYKP